MKSLKVTLKDISFLNFMIFSFPKNVFIYFMIIFTTYLVSTNFMLLRSKMTVEIYSPPSKSP